MINVAPPAGSRRSPGELVPLVSVPARQAPPSIAEYCVSQLRRRMNGGHRGAEAQRRGGRSRPACNAGRLAWSDWTEARTGRARVGSCLGPSPTARVPSGRRRTGSALSLGVLGGLSDSIKARQRSWCLRVSVSPCLAKIRHRIYGMGMSRHRRDSRRLLPARRATKVDVMQELNSE